MDARYFSVQNMIVMSNCSRFGRVNSSEIFFWIKMKTNWIVVRSVRVFGVTRLELLTIHGEDYLIAGDGMNLKVFDMEGLCGEKQIYGKDIVSLCSVG